MNIDKRWMLLLAVTASAAAGAALARERFATRPAPQANRSTARTSRHGKMKAATLRRLRRPRCNA